MTKRKFLLTISIIIIILLIIIGFFIARHFYLLWKYPFNLTPTTFNKLSGWDSDNQYQALLAFQQSCSEILKRKPDSSFGKNLPDFIKSTNANWQHICELALQLNPANDVTARNFFENEFQPYLVTNEGNSTGLFTGYYLPLLQGKLKHHGNYNVPIYGKPKDLIVINLGLFKPELLGIIVRGQIKDTNLAPYPNREEINHGAITKTAPVLVWVNDRISRFFMQVQGSGLVQISPHKILLLGYADTNGQPYRSLGKTFITKGFLTKDTASMHGIRNWFSAHPEQIDPLLNSDPSFIFFRILANQQQPVGTENVQLTPQRSLAVDTRYIPLGAPIWLNALAPKTKITPGGVFQHLVVAQDTGGAIKGIIRGDIYWGGGQDAENIASDLKSPGQYWILLPK